MLLSFVFPVSILGSATQYVLHKHVLSVGKPSKVRGGMHLATGEEFMRFSNASHKVGDVQKGKNLTGF